MRWILTLTKFNLLKFFINKKNNITENGKLKSEEGWGPEAEWHVMVVTEEQALDYLSELGLIRISGTQKRGHSAPNCRIELEGNVVNFCLFFERKKKHSFNFDGTEW